MSRKACFADFFGDAKIDTSSKNNTNNTNNKNNKNKIEKNQQEFGNRKRIKP